jgi:hypothetical protein
MSQLLQTLFETFLTVMNSLQVTLGVLEKEHFSYEMPLLSSDFTPNLNGCMNYSGPINDMFLKNKFRIPRVDRYTL